MELFKRFDHIGIAVRNVDSALSFYRDILGARVTVYRQIGTTDDYTFTQLLLTGQKIEFIEPVEGKQSLLTRFLNERGEGLHHVTFQVHELEKAVEHLRSRNVRVVDESFEDPTWNTAFISPRSSSGVLMQLYSTTAGSPYDH